MTYSGKLIPLGPAMALRFSRNRLDLIRGGRNCLTALATLVILQILAANPAQAKTRSDEFRENLRAISDVSDFARILNPADRAALEARCKVLREKTGAQFAVVIINSLEGGEVTDFTNKLFKQWGVGEKGKDNGLMLLVAVR